MTFARTEELYRALGKVVQKARDTANVTQEDLGQRIGLTRTSITNIEGGRQKIQVHVLYAIAEALDVRPDALLPRMDEAAPAGQSIEQIVEQMPEEPELRQWTRRILSRREE